MLFERERRLDRLAHSIACIGLIGLVLVAALVFADGLFRWLFALTIPGLMDAIRIALPVIVAATFPAALLRRQHVTIRFVGSVLGRSVTRWLDCFGSSLLLACLVAISGQLFEQAMAARANGDTTWILHLPLAPGYLVSSVLIGLSALAQVLIIIRDFAGFLDSESIG